MIATKTMPVTIPETLYDQAERLAQRLNISQNHLFEIALENFIKDQPDLNEPPGSAHPATQIEQQVINKGDIYWIQSDDLSESESGIRHPHVVIQDNVFNHSRLNTVVTCALTSNIKRASIMGNVLLEAGEANLAKQSVVEVSKVSAVDKAALTEYVGSLTEHRTNEILAGMRFLQLSFFLNK